MLLNDLAETITLDGAWDFSLGKNAPWSVIQLPGCWESQGFSKTVDGPAYFRREIEIPAHWEGLNIRAAFDAVSYACEMRVNGVEAGSHQGMWTSFDLDLTGHVHAGKPNLLELEVYKPGKRYPMRNSLAGFLPDVATTFGGVWQPARLQAASVWLDNVRIRADAETGCIRVSCQVEVPTALQSPLNLPVEWLVEVSLGLQPVIQYSHPLNGSHSLDVSLNLENPYLWSPAHPDLYTVRISLLRGGKPLAQLTRITGFRCLSTEGRQLFLNGEPFLVRGILSWGWSPDRIAPFYSLDQAKEEMRQARSMGFNTIKLCLFVPNQAYFDAADEEGMLLWEELPLWLPDVTPDLVERAPQEYAAIAYQVAGHPSVVLYSLGCELDKSVGGDLLARLNAAVRGEVTGGLVCENSGSGESYGGLDEDSSDFDDYHPYYDLHFFEPLLNNWRRDWKRPLPLILGEFCDSDTFRDPDEVIEANTGVRPWWMTADNPVTSWRPEALALLQQKESLDQADLGCTAAELKRISYAQSWVIRKYTLETLRRRSGVGGYVLTGLRDTPISTSGIWDDLGRPKWTAEEFRPINEDAVLSLEVSRRRRWLNGGDRPDLLDAHNLWSGAPFRRQVVLSHTGAVIPAGSQFTWSLSDSQGKVVTGGNSSLAHPLDPGEPCQVGVVECLLPAVQKAAEWRLEAHLTCGSQVITNHWPIWVYPPLKTPPANLVIFDPSGLLDDCGDWLNGVPQIQFGDTASETKIILATAWDEAFQPSLEKGARILMLQQGTSPFSVRRCPFWREAIKLFYDHPFWNSFPHRGVTDLQFFGLASDIAFNIPLLAQAFPFIDAIRPIMRRLDARQFTVNDYLFEARSGKGVLLACALRLQGGIGAQPFGWQHNVAGGAMLSALLNYLSDLEILC